MLYIASRRSDQIKCWDIRNTGEMLPHSFHRPGATNQRLAFSLDQESGRFLASGDTEGNVCLFDLNHEGGGEEVQPIIRERCHDDTVGGVDFHPSMFKMIASASGQRRYSENLYGTVKSGDETYDCSVKTWIM